MSGRDHSETCATCGFQRGGLDDVPCACDLPWAKALAASRDHWKAKHKALTAELLGRVVEAEAKLATAAGLTAEVDQLRAELARMRPVYEATLELRRVEREDVPGESIAELEANVPAAQRRSALALLRWRAAIDAATEGKP